MSLDIGEIGVRVAVRDPHEKQAAAGDRGSAPLMLAPAQQEEIIKECVRIVLQSLRKFEER